MKSSHRILTHITLLVFCATNILAWLSGGIFIEQGFSYTESDSNTFAPYQRQLIGIKQDLESEFRRNSTVSISSLQNAKNVVQSAYDRLPDNGESVSANSEAKKWTDLNIDLAIKNPSAQTYVSNAVLSIERFANEAKIKKITGSITANPATGNAPLTVSLLASNINDPSGVSPIPGNYIWWMRENGGTRRELWRWPSLVYSLNQEGSYQVFLDVVSWSRNSRGYTDTLPLSISQDIQVKPKLWEITLLINGVNVSSLSRLKINPTLGKIGIILDATASRAVSNGTIKKTKWDFGNGNTLEYTGWPVIERQLYTNQWTYDVVLEIETNEGSTFKKNFQLIIVEPAAVIAGDKTSGYIGEEFWLRAQTYFSNTKNTEYSWTIQSTESAGAKPLYTQVGPSINYTFSKVGDYIVTLVSKSPNGNEDRDSKTITIESHEPTVNLDTPRSISTEKPNILRFDASKSFDPDTKNSTNLTYRWSIDGNAVSLNNIEKDGAIGNYAFNTRWAHTVSLTVSNKYGKITTVERSFDVISTLAVSINIVPRAAPIWTMVSLQGISPRSAFYEWNLWDGSPSINGQMDNIDHIYRKTGVYSVTLTVKNIDGSEVNTIERKVYVTDSNTPYALIDIKNISNTAFEDTTSCSTEWAIVVNRSELTTLDGSNSINIDGNTIGLTYTWKYLNRIKTWPTLSEKFTELWCFPIELTVKSDKNGASHTSKKFIELKNIAPKLTAISTKIDQSKKDSQKLLVNVSADGVRDDDGVVTSYIWYYMTESDTEPQWVKITQSTTTTFVLPNVTEKYTFGVILEDNDWARTNSLDFLRDNSSLLVTNDDGNINMPLIHLSVPKTQALAGETVNFVVSAKTIVGSDITSKSIYQWDFDGDGKIDKKWPEARVSYTYPSAGNYTAKVKVTYNGTSNSKYQNIVVKNELKAKVLWYRSDSSVYLINASEGFYDTTFWQIGDIQSDAPYSLSLAREALEWTWVLSRNLTVSALGSESSSTEISSENILDIQESLSGGIYLQSYPKMENDTIHVRAHGERILISLYWNEWVQHGIDINTKIDSDTNGTPDDDIDNKNYPSFVDGSVFVIDSNDFKMKNQTIRVSLIKNGTVLRSRDISMIADFITDARDMSPDILSGSGWENFSERDKKNLETLQEKIRSLKSDDRIVLTQWYASLLENWDDTLERTKKLIEIQEGILESPGINESDKKELSSLIDTILVGDASAIDEITVATRVIESLIPLSNTNRAAIIEKLETIKSNPTKLSENKKLWSEILTFIQDDATIEVKYKNIIKSQLQIIISGGQGSVPDGSSWPGSSEPSGGILGFMKWAVIVFGYIIGIICIIILIGFIIYRISRKKDDIWFQDFLIDSIFHAKSSQPKWASESPLTPINTTTPLPVPISKSQGETTVSDPLNSVQDTYQKQDDPMALFSHNTWFPATTETAWASPSTENTPVQDEHANIPDWLKPKDEIHDEPMSTVEPPIPATGEWLSLWVDIDTLSDTDSVSTQNDREAHDLSENTGLSPESPPVTPDASNEDEWIPEWLRGMNEESWSHELPISDPVIDASVLSAEISDDVPTESTAIEGAPEDTLTIPEPVQPTGDLPDWLVNSVHDDASIVKKPTKKKAPAKKSIKKEDIPTPTPTPPPSWDLPDWLK